jgi:F-type H+-transporting ATPase subunit a
LKNSEPTRHRRRFGFYRWLILLLVVAGVFAAKAFKPVMPHIQVAAENLTGAIALGPLGTLHLTNTLTAILIVDILLVLAAWAVRQGLRKEQLVPSGVAGVMSAALEALNNLVESTAGQWARRIFPWVATIVLMVLLVNWMELIPGVDSIGLIHEPEQGGTAYSSRELFHIGNLRVGTITGEAQENAAGQVVGFTPLVRAASTDLNFTVALAVTSVVVSQILGIQAAGPGYFKKFFNVSGLGRMLFRERLGPFDLLTPFIDLFVGLLELVAEFARIISFSFRLFGNIFAGSVLLFVIGALVPVMAQSGLLILELFVGMIQALVFGILTLVFMSMATMGHGQHGEEHEPA